MTNSPLRSVRAAVSTLSAWQAVQIVAAVAACALAYNGARILNNSTPTQDELLDNFDSAMLWLGLALLALVIAAWPSVRPRFGEIRETAVGVWRDHYIEALLFAAIIGVAIFMRFFRFGDTLPPEIGLCCEEHINGGVAYEALQGDRPLLFPLTRWTSALGFLTFGETTMGLRFFFPVMGVATLVIFYFLLRQLVSVQSALFGLALYAVAWWPALRNRQTTAGTIYAVLFAFLAVRAMRTKNPLWFLAAGAVAGLMSYEYEAYRAIPIIAVGVLAAVAAREVLLGGRITEARARAVDLARMFWRPGLIFLLAAGIVLVPMIVGTHHGNDLYLTSVNRNVEGRDGERFSDEWPERLTWASTMFLPFGARDYPSSPPRDLGNTPLLDPLTAWLAVAGMAAGVAFLLRGYRFWFVVWIAGILTGGSLLLGQFAPWSFFGVIPIMLVLVAYFLDDLRAFLSRYGPRAVRGMTAALVLAFAFSFWWNADTLFNDVANETNVQRVYGGEISFMYAMCRYLQDRPDGNFTFAYSNAVNVDGFAAPRDTESQQRRAWSDFIWVCHDLQGRALPAAQEAWPLRDIPDGPVTLAFADPLGPVAELIAELNSAYPGLGAPDHRVAGPAKTYEFLAYDFASGAEIAPQGLWGTYTAGGSPEAQVDILSDLDLESAPFQEPFDVTWTGLIYVEEATAAALELVADVPGQVLVDGQAQDVASPEELLQGWHTVEITMRIDEPAGVVGLRWAHEAGTTAVAPEDTFPLQSLDGWLHTRSLGLASDPRAQVTQRFDFSPHLALATVFQRASGDELFVTEERYEGVVDVDEAGDYQLRAEFRAGTLSIVVDGEAVATADTGPELTSVLDAFVNLEPGRHTIELIQTLERAATWSGATLSITDSAGTTPAVRPY